MILSTFRTRVSNHLRDGNSAYASAYVDSMIDETITQWWFKISERVPHFYRKYATFIGITDAVASTDDEQYTTPTDMRIPIVMRRSDLQDKPKLMNVDKRHVDEYRWNNVKPYSRDADAPAGAYNVWAFYNATNFIIIPAPTAITHTFEFEYWRVHTATTGDGDTVDVPDIALTPMILQVAYNIKSNDNGAGLDNFKERVDQAWRAFFGEDIAFHAVQVPAVRRWWN